MVINTRGDQQPVCGAGCDGQGYRVLLAQDLYKLGLKFSLTGDPDRPYLIVPDQY